MNKTISLIARFVLALLLLAALWSSQSAEAATGNIDTANKYAWSENTGGATFIPQAAGLPQSRLRPHSFPALPERKTSDMSNWETTAAGHTTTQALLTGG